MRYLFIFLVLPFLGNAQGWSGSTPNNSVYTVNGASFNVNVGIGTGAVTAAQLHTTGTVRFAGLGLDNSQTRILVSDNDGDLSYRDASNLLSGGWLTTGNSIAGTNFIGTTNAQTFKIRTNNLRRMSVDSIGNVIINSQVRPNYVANRKLCVHTDDAVQYSSTLDITTIAPVLDGIVMANTSTSDSIRRGVAVTFISSSGKGGDGAAIINGVAVGSDQMDLTFQTENGSNILGEAMRITHDKRIGIATSAPSSSLHVRCAGTLATGVRFQNLPSGSGTQLVVDTDGNVLRATAPFNGGEDVDNLKKEIAELRQELIKIKNMLQGTNSHSLSKFTIYPNPALSNVNVRFNIEDNFSTAQCQIVDVNGNIVKTIEVTAPGSTNKNIDCSKWVSGTYYCSLVIDGKSETQPFTIVK